jgi:uncharacterized damage-inducible protein DinB
MSSADYLQNLVAYTAWADALALDAAARLTDDQLQTEPGGSRGSILENLRHLVGAQVRWYELMSGEMQGAQPAPPEEKVAGWLREQFVRSHEQLRAFVASLSDDDAHRDVEVSGTRLKRTRWPLWQVIAHVTLHSTQHRAETAVALTALGSSPGDLDYGHFCDLRQSQSPGTLDMARVLYGYNRWANDNILASLSGISDEALLLPRGLSHGSLGIDLAHALLAQRGWLSIWQAGAPEITLPRASSGRHLDNLVAGFGRADEAIDEFIASLDPEELGQARIDNPGGNNPSVASNRTLPLWDMMFHVVNHSMQHRSEAAMTLTALGRSPGDLDLLDYLDEVA